MTAEQFRPTFTTSAKAGEERLEEREETLGKNFHQRVHTVEGTVPPDPRRVKPSKVFLARPVEPGPSHMAPEPLKPHQEQLLTKRQRQQNRRKGK